MWRELKVPYVCERYIGFSIPLGGEFWAVSCEGIHRLEIAATITVTNYTEDKYAEGAEYYDWQSGVLRFADKQMPIVGLYGGIGIPRSALGESLVLRPATTTLYVVGFDETTQFEYRYVDLSGDWAVATFSYDGQHIVIGMPYDLYVLQRESER